MGRIVIECVSLVLRNIVVAPKSEKWVYCFPLIKSSLQMCCNLTVCFKIPVIKFEFCSNSMISQPFPNFKTLFSQVTTILHWFYSCFTQHYKCKRGWDVLVELNKWNRSKVKKIIQRQMLELNKSLGNSKILHCFVRICRAHTFPFLYFFFVSTVFLLHKII